MPLNIPRPPKGLDPALQAWANGVCFELERFGRESVAFPEPLIGDANKVLRGDKSWTDLIALLATLSFGAANLADTVAPASFTPADASGTGPAFSAVSVRSYRLGNLIHVYGQLTYGASVDGAQAAITLPVAVPNVNYAAGPSPGLTSNGPTILMLQPIPNTSKAVIFSPAAITTNANMNNGILYFNLIYPAT